MTAYYNEIDHKAAAWLRELIAQDLIAPGEVDERSIEDVSPADLDGFTQCHFFAGIGVWSYALRQAGWPDDRPVWTGSCPCQPFSAAGQGKGFADERHLWPALFWLVQQCRPVVCFGEQVAGKDGKTWLDLVSADLEGIGYSCGATVAPACGFGAPHQRNRMYWVADSTCAGRKRRRPDGTISVRVESKRAVNGDPLAVARRALDHGVSGLLQRDGTTPGLERSSIKGYGNALFAPQAQAFVEAYLETQEATT